MKRVRRGVSLEATPVFDSYWRFAAERLQVFFRRRSRPFGPWTDDNIIQKHRFTNSYRVLDRVSQFLVAEVQYSSQYSADADEVFFRTLLFKIFNRIETWRALEARCGPISFKHSSLTQIEAACDHILRDCGPLYSAAYIMPAPQLGHERKHANHLALLDMMMRDKLPHRLEKAASLRQIFEMLLGYPGLGKFLAFQYAIDLNYSQLCDFSEGSFVVAGPGALDGISKCFGDTGGRSPESVIEWVTDRQDEEFARRGIDFGGLFGRKLQPIDCQNLFCEISKYARIAHPDVPGVLGRTRIKQVYSPDRNPLPPVFLPPKWKLAVRDVR